MGGISPTIGVSAQVDLANATGTLPVANGGTGQVTVPAARLAILDYTTTATAAGTTTLTVASTYNQFFTGVTTQTVVMPVASTMTVGMAFRIVNDSTGALTVNSSGSNLVTTVPAGASVIITCILASGTSAASWSVDQQAQVYLSAAWTPVLTFATPGDLSVAYTTQLGRYTRIGNMVTLSGSLLTSTFTHTTASGNLQITGTPFASGAGFTSVGQLRWSGFSTTATDLCVSIGTGTSIITCVGSTTAASLVTMTTATTPTATVHNLVFSLTYQV